MESIFYKQPIELLISGLSIVEVFPVVASLRWM